LAEEEQEYGINPEIQALHEGKVPEPEVTEEAPAPMPEPDAEPVPTVKSGQVPRDFIWLCIWLSTIAVVGVWDLLFLNKPAFKQVAAGLINTFFISFQVIIYTLILAWAVTVALQFLESRKNHTGYLVLTFFLNLTRSVPQIVGVLFGYIWITSLFRRGSMTSSAGIFSLMALVMSLFIFVELVDLMRDRIRYFKTLDFYNAMRVCGISENRIINFHILWKNSRIHIFNKLIAVFGIAVFLQCSVDFIISVGLSLEADLVTLPATLGSLLAKIDSKQDILAIGYTLTHPGYFSNLFFKHLQGLTVSFLIVFSLLSIYHISNGYAERHRL
jgi:ABC-type dipeptide/oligopeptide/nickel transport system permease subunit